MLGYGVDRAAGQKNIVLGAAGGTAGTGIGALAGLLVIMFSYALLKPVVYKKRNMTEIKKQQKQVHKLQKYCFVLLHRLLQVQQYLV